MHKFFKKPPNLVKLYPINGQNILDSKVIELNEISALEYREMSQHGQWLWLSW